MTSKGSRRVVITATGALCPVGNNVELAWKNLLAGNSGGGLISRFDASELPVRIACELKDFEPLDYFSQKEINRYDRLSLYALVAAEQAWQQSGLMDFSLTEPVKAGVIWASGNGGIESIEQAYQQDKEFPGRFSPYLIPRILIDTPSGMICLKYGLKGINYCPVSACASATTAFMDAYNYIKWGKADLMIAGASEAPITRINIGGFGAMKALSRQNDQPATASKPLDSNRNGFVMGEGAGALILEELEHAQNRGAQVLAEIAGAGMSNDAYHATATHPEGEGAVLAMNMALEEAGIRASALNYVNLHATSTPAGDLSELRALASLIPQADRKNVYVSSTKGATGHLLGAAGAIEGIFCVQSILDGIIPATINTENPDEQLPDGFSYVWKNPVRSANITYAMSNNFGFGGHNAVFIIKKYT